METMFLFPITSMIIVDTLRLLPLMLKSDCHHMHYLFLKKYLEQLLHSLEHYEMSVWNLAYFQSALKYPKLSFFQRRQGRWTPRKQSHFLQPLENFLKKIFMKKFRRFWAKQYNLEKLIFFRRKLCTVDAMASLTEQIKEKISSD